MQLEPVENALLSKLVNPVLRFFVKRFDVECVEDGNLLTNSLKDFIGENVELCPTCEHLNRNVARPFYTLGSKMLRVDKRFMKNQFLDKKYGGAWFKGFALMMKGIEKYGIRIPFTPAGPFEIVWNFTYLCNLRCKHCYENAGVHRPELNTEQAFEVLDKLSKIAGVGLPALSFSGGEPMIRKDFFEVAAYAKKKIPYISIATNGTFLTKDNAKKVKDVGIDYAEISLDGATKEVHESFRGVLGCFEKTLNGIRNSVDEGLDTCIAMTIHKDNLNEVEKVVELAEELGVRFMHFNYVPTGRAPIALDLTPKERLSILELIGGKLVNLYLKSKEEERKTGKSKISVDRFFSTCPQYASVTKQLSQKKGEKFMVESHYAAKKGVEDVANFLGGCGAGRLYCCIEPNGDIKPCVFFPTNKHTVVGNIIEDSFKKIWDHNELLWKLRTRENLTSYKINGHVVGCGTCKDRYICGGCRARSYSYFSGKVNEPDVGCIENKEIWELIAEKLL